jgi:hypothetical protein
VLGRLFCGNIGEIANRVSLYSRGCLVNAFRIAVRVLVCVISLTVFAQPTPKVLKLPKPLMGNVVENQAETLGVYIRADGAIGHLRNDRLFPTGASVCVPASVTQFGIAFDNDSATEWRVRLLPPPPPPDAIPTECATLQCARTKEQLQNLGLCDGGGDADQCITTDDALARCIGPECTVLRNNCKLTGAVENRRCEMKVGDVIAACERRCDTVLQLPASAKHSPNPGERLVDEGIPFNKVPRMNVTFTTDLLPKDKTSYEFVIENNAGISTPFTVTKTAGSACLPLMPQSTTFREVAIVPLDNVGVASWIYLNPRLPACLACDQELPALAFENRTSDRAFTVSIDLPAEVASAVPGCKAGKPCSISRTVQPNNATIIDAEVLALVPPKTLLRFSVGFYDEIEKPSNPVAYLTIGPDAPEEPKGELGTNIVAKVGGVIDPFVAAVPDKFVDADGNFIDDSTGFVLCYPTTPEAYAKDAEPALCAPHRVYDGDFARHYTGLARIELTKNLGSRADITAVVNYRTSDFGVDDGNQVKLSEYGVNIYGANAAVFRFGRTTWASPANGISIFEKGDGFRVAYKYFTLAHLIRRESAKSVADPGNDDSRSIIGQIKSIPLAQTRTKNLFLRGLRLLDITAVRGEDKLSHIYTTAGAEVFYTYPNLGLGTLGGSVAAFQSSRHAKTGTTTVDGEGWAGLFTATYVPTTRRQGQGFEAVRSYTLQFGKGSSDDPATTGTREDYIGEGGTFSADTIFMSTFLSKINSKGHVLIGPSLANKTYIGLQIVDNTRSLLGLVASALQVEDDVISRSSTLRLRQFRFNRPVYTDTDSKEAVREISLDFSIEVPKGVRWSIGGGYMSTGKGLESVIIDDAWTVTTSVSLTL